MRLIPSRGNRTSHLPVVAVMAVQVLIFVSPTSNASTTTIVGSDQCDSAARQSAGETGVPITVLMAISRTETGRTRNGRVSPWPWTVNMEGRGIWFESHDEAQTYVLARHADGARNFDVGCFQVNYRWHGAQFASIEAMLDPLTNARYAAQFLAELHGEFGSWEAAAGAYHSRTDRHARRYLTTYRRHYATLASGQDTRSDAPPSRRPNEPVQENTFPLLRSNNLPPTGLGSLMPQAAQRAGVLLEAM
jgi:hypothetical protein